MIIIARENFNAYGPDKLGLFAGEIADIPDDFAQKIIDEGKAYKYDYEKGSIVPTEQSTT